MQERHKRADRNGVKEKKAVTFPGWSGVIRKVFHATTELSDVVDCLMEALPDYLQKRYKNNTRSRDGKGSFDVDGKGGGKWVSSHGGLGVFNPNYSSGLIGKLNYLDRHWDSIDINKAVECMILNHFEDKVIGAMNRGAQRATGRPGFPVSGSWGPAL